MTTNRASFLVTEDQLERFGQQIVASVIDLIRLQKLTEESKICLIEALERQYGLTNPRGKYESVVGSCVDRRVRRHRLSGVSVSGVQRPVRTRGSRRTATDENREIGDSSKDFLVDAVDRIPESAEHSPSD